jgi:hypothetical protein
MGLNNIKTQNYVQSSILESSIYTPSPQSTTRAGDNNNFSNLDPRTQYLIITPQNFIEALKPLATWKHQKGVFTGFMPLDGPSGINSTYAGVDLPAKIHAFLRDFYVYAPTLKWLLLVGDSEIIPPRLILTNNITGSTIEYLSNHTYSDYYYSALDTNWDNNSNLIYGESGEEDWVPELAVGRLPVNNIDEVFDVVNKILYYEKNPPHGDWFSRTIQCGALMDRPNIIDNLATPQDEGYNSYKDNAYEVLLKVRKLFPEWMENYTFLDYEKMEGGEYTKANDTLNESNVLAPFNLGASTVNFVSKGDDDGVRHYNGNGLGKIEYNSKHFFDYNTLRKVSNGYRLPLVYTSSCTSANFTETDDSNLEGLITNPIGGAIGFIGATIDTYRLEFFINDSSYGNWWLNEEFWRKFYTGEGDFRPGQILYQLKEDYYKLFTNTDNDSEDNPHPEIEYIPLFRTNFFSYNLLGDPEVPIYTNTPTQLRVEHPQKILPINRNHSFTIKVFDMPTNQPIINADVCILGNGIYLTARTDSQGIARFELLIEEEETLTVTVTAHNHYYYEGKITIEARQDVLIKQENINFDRNPIPPDVTSNITIEVINNGSMGLSNIKVNCYYDEIKPEKIIIQDLIIESLPIKGSKVFNFNWTPPLGSHFVIVFVDADNDIFESNESNNIAENLLIENIPPIISSLPDKIMDEDTQIQDVLDLIIYSWDFDTPAHELEYFILNLSYTDFNITINGSMVSLYPPSNWYGTVQVMVGVTDGTSVDTDDFSIHVQPVNDPPIINDTTDWIIPSENITVAPGKITVLEDSVVQVIVVGDDPIDNNKNLTFSAQTDLFEINLTSGEIYFVPDNSMVGIYEINFSVNDGHEDNGSAWRFVTFEIINVNDPPEISFINKQYLTVGELFELIIEANDLDTNDTLHFRENTNLFNIDNATGQISFKPKETDIGTHKVKITVTDGDDSDSETLTLIIKSAPEKPVDPNYVLICPAILIILLVFLFAQEYLKNRKNKKNGGKKERNQEKDNKIGNNDFE